MDSERKQMFVNKSDLRLPLTKVFVCDVEGLTVDIRWNAKLPLYCICVLTVDSSNSKKIHKFYDVSKAIAYIQQLFDNGWLFIAHNAKFDYSALKVRGLKHTIVPGELSVACTMSMAHTEDSTRQSYSLQSLTGEKTDVIQSFVNDGLLEKRISEQEFWSTDWSGNIGAITRIADYCSQDLRATWGLYKRLARQYNSEPKFISTLAYLEFPMLEVLSNLETSGSGIDTKLMLNTITSLEQRKREIEQQITTEAGLMPVLKWRDDTYVPYVHEYKGGQSKNKRNLLKYYIDNEGIALTQWEDHLPTETSGTIVYNHCPLVPYNGAAATGHTWWLLKRYCPDVLAKAESTKAGKPQMNKEYLKDVADEIPEHLPLSTLAKVNKLLSMVEGISSNVAHDGRIHASFNSTATRTSRLACVKPNLQQMPRLGTMVDDVDYGKQIRSLFAASEGHKILVADLN